MESRKGIKDLEIVALFLSLYSIILCYSSVSYLASLRGFNIAPTIATSLDWKISFDPFWIIFYFPTVVYVPVITLILLRLKIGPDPIEFRRMIFSTGGLVLVCYLIFLLFPCSVIEMFQVPNKIWADSFFAKMARVQFGAEAPWNDHPSLHVALSWMMVRYFLHYYKNDAYDFIYLFWFAGMVISTLMLKVHIIANLALGFIMAELTYQYVFNNPISLKVAHLLGHYSLVKRFSLYGVVIFSFLLFDYLVIFFLGSLSDISNPYVEAWLKFIMLE